MDGIFHGSNWAALCGKPTPFWECHARHIPCCRKKAPVPTPKEELISGMPLCHPKWFRDTHENTYYSPAMIRQGVQTVAHMEAIEGGGGGHEPPPYVESGISNRPSLAPSPPQAPTIHPKDGNPHVLAHPTQEETAWDMVTRKLYHCHGNGNGGVQNPGVKWLREGSHYQRRPHPPMDV